MVADHFVPRHHPNPADYGPDHPMVDEHGKPTTWDDGPGCIDVTMAQWPHPLEQPMLLSTFHRYIGA